MKNNRKKVMILTNHSYMLYRFRKELIEELMKNYDVVLSMPFVGHHEDFINMGLRCIETKMERRGVNPIQMPRFLWNLIRIGLYILILLFTEWAGEQETFVQN